MQFLSPFFQFLYINVEGYSSGGITLLPFKISFKSPLKSLDTFRNLEVIIWQNFEEKKIFHPNSTSRSVFSEGKTVRYCIYFCLFFERWGLLSNLCFVCELEVMSLPKEKKLMYASIQWMLRTLLFFLCMFCIGQVKKKY